MRQRVELEPAYILSSRPYRESSQLLEIFCAAHGRVGLVARGVRSKRSRLGGVLQPFTPLLLSWSQAGELGTLSAAEAQAAAAPLQGERVLYGWYLNELLLRLLQRHDAHARLYGRYVQAVEALQGEVFAAQCALRVFEKHLLAEIGYALELPPDLCAVQRYRYEPERGPQPDVAGYSGASLIALRDERFDNADVMQETRRLLARILATHLGGQPLRTQTLLRQLRGGASQRDE